MMASVWTNASLLADVQPMRTFQVETDCYHTDGRDFWWDEDRQAALQSRQERQQGEIAPVRAHLVSFVRYIDQATVLLEDVTSSRISP